MRIQFISRDITRNGPAPGLPWPLLGAVVLLFFTCTVWLFAPEAPGKKGVLAGGHHGYRLLKASNGVELHTIDTLPGNIGLTAIQSNVTDTPDNGINGGFFWEGQLLSIAVLNDQPVKGAPGDYGSGWYNTDRARGTLVWDGVTGKLSVQVAEAADELKVTDRGRYWAQGGVSMGLANENSWKAQALSEEFPAMEENRLRSGMVYDKEGRIWLLVTTTPCTGEAFRDAVKEKIAPGKLLDGIFLDGDGSSQLKLDKLRIVGDRRPVYQMITLRKW
ncbi:hypothetical protein [Gorillibacterium sp. sgz5001074]|uniref:hypothetical protein n=1 Tax=Gorillibacterium sp. sgz5001074 TaxID=3446695 RepID=UPI003F66B158